MTSRLQNLPAGIHQHRHLKRRQVDEILALAPYLSQADRTLIEQVIGQGVPVTRVARLFQRPSRQLGRRLESTLKRMSTKLFKYVALQMDTLPCETRNTARSVVLHGQSLRETARTSDMSLYQVRNHMNTIRATARLLA